MRTVKIQSLYSNIVEVTRWQEELCWLSIGGESAKLNTKQCRKAAAALIKAAEEIEKEK